MANCVAAANGGEGCDSAECIAECVNGCGDTCEGFCGEFCQVSADADCSSQCSTACIGAGGNSDGSGGGSTGGGDENTGGSVTGEMGETGMAGACRPIPNTTPTDAGTTEPEEDTSGGGGGICFASDPVGDECSSDAGCQVMCDCGEQGAISELPAGQCLDGLCARASFVCEQRCAEEELPFFGSYCRL